MRRSPVVDFRRQFYLAARPERVWQQISKLDDYESWWPWLRRFHSERAGMVSGNVLRGLVVPPVPYPFRMQVTLDECCPPATVRASVAGDVTGSATVDFEPVGEGTVVTCCWTLRMDSLPMRVAARTAYPVLRWGHDRVVQVSVNAFAAHLDTDR